MAVVINEFEVVVEAPARAEESAVPGAPSAAPQGATPQDVELINRRLEERAARVRAD
ncbi:MAG TPA: hypothetical protein VER32_04875 [Pyrinomonadaceae bacterium]|nr:hypothetical protein [Pyrinomonadaceae bacterium]